MPRFIACPLDSRAERTREWMRQQPPRDFKDKSMRLALHLSSDEAASLERLNPDTLGHDDSKLRDAYWKQFAVDPASKPYRVQKV